MKLEEANDLPKVLEKINELIGRIQLLETRIVKYDNLNLQRKNLNDNYTKLTDYPFNITGINLRKNSHLTYEREEFQTLIIPI